MHFQFDPNSYAHPDSDPNPDFGFRSVNFFFSNMVQRDIIGF